MRGETAYGTRDCNNQVCISGWRGFSVLSDGFGIGATHDIFLFCIIADL